MIGCDQVRPDAIGCDQMRCAGAARRRACPHFENRMSITRARKAGRQRPPPAAARGITAVRASGGGAAQRGASAGRVRLDAWIFVIFGRAAAGAASAHHIRSHPIATDRIRSHPIASDRIRSHPCFKMRARCCRAASAQAPGPAEFHPPLSSTPGSTGSTSSSAPAMLWLCYNY